MLKKFFYTLFALLILANGLWHSAKASELPLAFGLSKPAFIAVAYAENKIVYIDDHLTAYNALGQKLFSTLLPNFSSTRFEVACTPNGENIYVLGSLEHGSYTLQHYNAQGVLVHEQTFKNLINPIINQDGLLFNQNNTLCFLNYDGTLKSIEESYNLFSVRRSQNYMALDLYRKGHIEYNKLLCVDKDFNALWQYSPKKHTQFSRFAVDDKGNVAVIESYKNNAIFKLIDINGKMAFKKAFKNHFLDQVLFVDFEQNGSLNLFARLENNHIAQVNLGLNGRINFSLEFAQDTLADIVKLGEVYYIEQYGDSETKLVKLSSLVPIQRDFIK